MKDYLLLALNDFAKDEPKLKEKSFWETLAPEKKYEWFEKIIAWAETLAFQDADLV